MRNFSLLFSAITLGAIIFASCSVYDEDSSLIPQLPTPPVGDAEQTIILYASYSCGYS